MATQLATLAAVFGLLFFGALNTLTTKIQFTMESPGSDGVVRKFEKPWFAVFNMFAAMTVVLGIHYAQVYMAQRKRAPLQLDPSPFLQGASNQGGMTNFKAFCYVGIPAVFDLAGSGLIFVGLLFVSASIWQMLRGSMIVFASLISIPALGRKLYCFHWIGIVICVSGIVCVGASNILNGGDQGGSGDSSKSVLGMCLVLGGQVVTASQMVAEEKLLKDVQLPPMQIVGFEGLWGSILMILVVFPFLQLYPGSDNGSAEDTFDSIAMVRNNSSLLALVLLYLFSCATYNMSGMFVTSSLSAVHRSMLEATRTAVIWGFDLCVHYLIDPTIPFGEAWMPYSPLQLLGFLLLITGQAVYSGVIALPGVYYPPPEAIPTWSSPAALSSPGMVN